MRFMSGEYQPTPALFDLDALDQDSFEAARDAQDAEFQRITTLPDHAEAIESHALLIQELDTSDASLEDKAANFLRTQAIEIAIKLDTEPDTVADESVGFAARFFAASDASRETVAAAFDRYHDYVLALSWAVTYNRTIAQARQEIAATRPHFRVDYGLIARRPDPFRSLDTIDWPDDEP